MNIPRFHLAFPVRDLAEARAFYGDLLGCPEGRSSDEWIDFDFHGHQIVAHLAPDEVGHKSTNAVDGHDVPVRHFGAILAPADWEALAQRLSAAGTRFVIEPHTRFAGEPGEQSTMFFLDPSGNALEFKAFADDAMVFCKMTAETITTQRPPGLAIGLADIEAAAARIKGHAVETPLLESQALNERLGFRVLIKPETLQRVGAFKFRGAYNRLVQLTPEEREVGVVAFSSGNHAQGVALAAKLLGVPALIVMPADAPALKIANTRGYGAEIKLYDRLTESREKIAAAIAAERGAVMVPAFDDPHIMAGQGTAGLELVRQARAVGVDLDAVIAPCSGGGLLSGVATAVKALSPATAIYGVEPAGYDDTRTSLAAGKRTPMTPTFRTLCDALETPCPGELTFPILQRTVADVAVVTDAEVAEAMRVAFTMLKLVVEPGGSVGLAAMLAGRIAPKPGQAVGLVLSGGNVNPELFARVLKAEI